MLSTHFLNTELEVGQIRLEVFGYLVALVVECEPPQHET